jgi:hypothetical protein
MSDVQPTVQHPFGYHLAQWRFPTVYLIWSFICLIEFSIVTHCDAELIPREPFFDVPWIHALPPEEYLDTQWTVHEHEFTLTIVMQLLLFNLTFPRIWIRLLPRHLSTSLLFSALLALLCSALHSYIQLHSYTAIQLHSYTAIQPHSYTDRQTDRQTDRDRQYRVHGLASKCTYAGCGHHVYLPRHMAMGMDCHLFAYLADESPLLHMSIYPYIFQYSSLSTFIHGLLCPFSKHFIYRYFHFSTWKDQRSNRFLSNFNIWSWYPTNLNHIWILSVH